MSTMMDRDTGRGGIERRQHARIKFVTRVTNTNSGITFYLCPFTFYLVPMKEGPKMSTTMQHDSGRGGLERRVHPRVKFVTRVTNTYSGVSHYYFSRDISLGGMFLETHQPYPEGTTLALEFALEGVDEKLRVEATVVRTIPPDLNDPTRSTGMGLVFDKVSDKNRKALMQFLVQRTLPEKSLAFDGQG
jgi:uncharacterized protein (TIGR02266 family)